MGKRFEYQWTMGSGAVELNELGLEGWHVTGHGYDQGSGVIELLMEREIKSEEVAPDPTEAMTPENLTRARRLYKAAFALRRSNIQEYTKPVDDRILVELWHALDAFEEAEGEGKVESG